MRTGQSGSIAERRFSGLFTCRPCPRFLHCAGMFAIVDIAGFQEKVQEGDLLQVPTLDAKEGATVTFDQVLLLAKGEDNVMVGQPTVSGVMVEAKVLGHGRDDKIRVVKMRRRKRYRRVHGHRQAYTEIEIMKIDVGAPKVGTGRSLQNKG